MLLKLCWLLFFLSLSCSIRASTQEEYRAALTRWAQVLQTHVDQQGRTDFKALAKEPDDLKSMVEFIEQTSPATTPELFATHADVLAYHINAYNALAMYGVIQAGIPKDLDGIFRRAAFFRFRSITVGGQQTTLHKYENEVIRPLQEPRVHFLLNCMVRDCPRLPQQPVRAESLEQQLQDATIEFFSRQKHRRIDAENSTLYLSAILNFYTEDFVPSGQASDLVGYVNQYLSQAVPADYRVEFLDYDWTINQQP